MFPPSPAPKRRGASSPSRPAPSISVDTAASWLVEAGTGMRRSRCADTWIRRPWHSLPLGSRVARGQVLCHDSEQTGSPSVSVQEALESGRSPPALVPAGLGRSDNLNVHGGSEGRRPWSPSQYHPGAWHVRPQHFPAPSVLRGLLALCARQKGNYSPANPEMRRLDSLVVTVLIERPLATAARGLLAGAE
jgi:hypothetical protein